VLQPQLSARILARKAAAICEAAGEDAIVASANPGCMIQLRRAGLDARHPADLLAEALE
jgi:Fe-S oxidoreductase